MISGDFQNLTSGEPMPTTNSNFELIVCCCEWFHHFTNLIHYLNQLADVVIHMAVNLQDLYGNF